MKKHIFLLFALIIVLVSCKTETSVIDGNTPLKNIPTEVFTVENTSIIQVEERQISYNNYFERLPNTEFSKFHLKKHADTYLPYFNLTLNLSADNKITFEGTPNDPKHLVKEIKEFIDFASIGKTTMLHLNFDENVSFNQFYEFLQLIKPIETRKIKINTKLFIYDIKQLPDCDCSL